MKKVGILIAIFLLGIGVYFALNSQTADRIGYISSLFTGVEQAGNFSRAKEIFPTTRLVAATEPFQFSTGSQIELPEEYQFDGEKLSVGTFLQDTDTAALLIIQNGAVRFEQYWLTGGRKVNWLSMSVAKSFISTLIGIALEEGHIESINQPITQYCPSLKGSAYDGVRIKDILQMSSGASWNEDYSDPNSDIMRFGQIMAIGGSLNEFAATLVRENEPGTKNHYNSTDTQVLGMLLTSATGRSVTDYMQEKLWSPLGMESDAYWMVDDENMEMAFGGLNATARDYAKLGELYRNSGVWQGIQVVPEAWVKAATAADAPHLLPQASEFGGFGYGYQWWLPAADANNTKEFTAIGVYNQFIYVNPDRHLVIVKLSANRTYGMDLQESSYRERETIQLFRAIGETVAEID